MTKRKKLTMQRLSSRSSVKACQTDLHQNRVPTFPFTRDLPRWSMRPTISVWIDLEVDLAQTTGEHFPLAFLFLQGPSPKNQLQSCLESKLSCMSKSNPSYTCHWSLLKEQEICGHNARAPNILNLWQGRIRCRTWKRSRDAIRPWQAFFSRCPSITTPSQESTSLKTSLLFPSQLIMTLRLRRILRPLSMMRCDLK